MSYTMIFLPLYISCQELIISTSLKILFPFVHYTCQNYFERWKSSFIRFRVFIKYYVFFLKILEYSWLWPFTVFPWCQCVYTHQAGRAPALQQNWKSSEKSQNFKGKTQYLMNTLYFKGIKLYIFSFHQLTNNLFHIVRAYSCDIRMISHSEWYLVLSRFLSKGSI